ncbi:exodeoxyribonuclease VII small subunit [Desulfovibrio sp. OttesenSCG-928-G15]|nr:exodeoxyribonuclease VII small subunit [Desulfovibrio sp. OttesenSCG-928-G15]
MTKKTSNTFESQMERLQQIIDELERGDISLEHNVALYKEGRSLAKSCKELLDKARHEILVCSEDGAQTPFNASAEE